MSSADNDSTERPATVRYVAEYQEFLEQATTALTAAARLRRPVLQPTDDGQWIESLSGATEQADWAEFVTLALAGAAANIGGVDAILAGRSGSWEAEGVRQLLLSTTGTDESNLWPHRTEPLDITLYVDELVVDHTHALSAYDDANAEITRRYEAADAEWDPEIDERLTWTYDRNAEGEFIARSADAPAWSWDAWRASASQDLDVSVGSLDSIEASLRRETHEAFAQVSAYIAKSEEAGAEHRRLHDAHEAKLVAVGELEDRLEEQRRAEWTAYGEALKARVEATAAAINGLMVPVRVVVDAETFRTERHEGRGRDGFWNSLEARLIETALMDTPTPADLPGTPLTRLEQP